jgi:hypothetical protein
MTEYDAIIIGAGVAGIITSKYLSGIGIKHIILEKRERFGGIWAYSDNPNITTVTKKTIMTSSKQLSHFSDLIPSSKLPEFMSAIDFYDYLRKFIKKYDVEKNIICDQNVTNIYKKDNKHIVSTDKTEYSSKYLIICTGLNYKRSDVFSKKYPEYTGKIYNAQEIKFNKQLFNKSQTAMVYGGGETASDMTMDTYYQVEKLIWCIPNGMWGFKRSTFNGEFANDTRNNYVVMQLDLSKTIISHYFNLLLTGQSGTDVKNFDCNKQYQQKYLNKSVEPIIKVHQKKIIPKQKVKLCKNKNIIFNDNTKFSVDVVIDCSSYQTNPIFNVCSDNLFKECINIEDPTLMYVGYCRPILGSMMIVCEFQALLLSYHLQKNFTKKNMTNDIIKDKKYYSDLDTSRLKVINLQKYVLDVMELVGRKIPKYNDDLPEIDKLILQSSVSPIIINYKYNTDKCYDDYLKIFKKKNPKKISMSSVYFSYNFTKIKWIEYILPIFYHSLNFNKNRRIERMTNNYPYLVSLISGALIKSIHSSQNEIEMKNLTYSSIPHNYPWAKTLSYNYFNCPTIDGTIVSVLIFLMSSVILYIFKQIFNIKNQKIFTLSKIFMWSFFYKIIRFIDVGNKFKPLIHVLLYKMTSGDNYDSSFLSLTYIVLYKLLVYSFNAVVLL